MLAALLVLNVESDEDLALMPQLVEEAWRLHGYHLQLGVLSLARAAAWRLDPGKQAEFGGFSRASTSSKTGHSPACSSRLWRVRRRHRAARHSESHRDDIGRALSEPFNRKACAFAAPS